MPIDPQVAIADIDAVLTYQPPFGGTAGVSEVSALSVACIERWAPPGSSYRKMLSDLELFSPKYNKADVHLHAILTALRRDYEQGQVRTFEELVHAALFDDFEAQAEYLLDEGYLLPATVIAGATLEEHLRQLATKNSIAITMTDAKGKVRPRKAAELNDDLYKAKGYSQPEWRQLQAWLVLRNEAAHGKPEFAGRTDGDIRPMIESIRAFIARYPA